MPAIGENTLPAYMFGRALPGGMTEPAPSSLDCADRPALKLLAEVLRKCSYPGSATHDALAQELGSLHRKRDLPLYLRRLPPSQPLATLVKLFAFQASVPEAEARLALAPLDLERCAEMGILRLDGGEVTALVSISASDNLFVAHDPAASGRQGETHPDHVLGVSPPTLVLARLVLREPAKLALDLGTGCGVQALQCASHCEHVIGTDVNARALEFARFNAVLNGIENVEFRLGSMFEPVAGEKFNLIVSNPPYVISPESRLMFRDGGQTADGFCRNLVREIPSHLAVGGFACMLANWAHYRPEHWSAPIREWVSGGSCDCWALRGVEHNPLSYAADWNRHRERESYARALDEWTAYYERLGITSISTGGLVLRRRASGAPWFRADELGAGMPPMSEAIVRVFAIEDDLAAAPDAELLDWRLVTMPSHKLTQVLSPENGDYVIESMRLETTHHPSFAASMDQNALHLLRRSNGARALREILAEIAEMTGGSIDECQARGIKIVRGLLANGVLGRSIPPGAGSINA